MSDANAIAAIEERSRAGGWTLDVAGAAQDARSLLSAELGGLMVYVRPPDRSGFELMAAAAALFPRMPVLAMMEERPEMDDVNRVQQLGAVLCGLPLEPASARQFFDHCAREAESTVTGIVRGYRLTDARRKVLVAGAESSRYDRIARKLDLGQSTVKTHVAGIIGNTGVSQFEDLVARIRARSLRW